MNYQTLYKIIAVKFELKSYQIKSLWPNDAIWWHRCGFTLDQVMASCLTAPSHYLNQYWLEITAIHSSATLQKMCKILWQKLSSNFFLKMFVYASPSGQWVKILKFTLLFILLKFQKLQLFCKSDGKINQAQVIHLKQKICTWKLSQVNSLVKFQKQKFSRYY